MRELWVRGDLYRQRADIVGFVNGVLAPSLADTYFRNVTGVDVAGTNEIQVSGKFSYNGYPEEPISWKWTIDSVPLWTNTPFTLTSSDSDNDGLPGSRIGGANELADTNVALDANIEAVELKPDAFGPYTVSALYTYDAGSVDLFVPRKTMQPTRMLS